jgi:hypothetical protein
MWIKLGQQGTSAPAPPRRTARGAHTRPRLAPSFPKQVRI